MQRHVAGHGPEAAGRIRDVQPGRPRYHMAAEHLQPPLQRREGLQRGHAAVADHQFGLAAQQRLHQQGDIGGVVLVIGVSIDDEVRAEPQAGLQPGGKGGRQPGVMRQPQHMIHLTVLRGLRGAVSAAVIDHQQLHLIDPVDAARQLHHRLRQRFGFVIAGDLDNEFHSGW